MNIVVVGLGVIGGSFAMALKEASYQQVYGIDTNQQTLEKAKQMGLIKDGSVTGELFLKQADGLCFLVLCLVLLKFYQTLRQKPLFQPKQ